MRAPLAALILAFTATACTRTLPPPRSPEPTLSDGTTRPGRGQAGVAGQTGLGRVVISTDVPARVERLGRLEGLRYEGVSAMLLCAETPCEVVLPYGDYEIRFTSTSDSGRTSQAVLGVHDESVVLRHALGQHHSTTGLGPVIMIVGAVTLAGAAIAAAALQSPPNNPSNGPSGPPPKGSSDPAPYIALGGIGVFGLGLVLTLAPPSLHQDGATTQWSPPVPGPRVGGSLGFRF